MSAAGDGEEATGAAALAASHGDAEVDRGASAPAAADGSAAAAAAESVKRPAGGQRGPRNRTLDEESDVFKHNAWDNVEWTDEAEQNAREVVAKQAESAVSAEQQALYEKDAANFWDTFYGVHQNRFFKDRHWLFQEFPELLSEPSAQDGGAEAALQAAGAANERFQRSAHSKMRVLEVGCGAGNTVFPLLAENKSADFFVYACDFSPTAVNIVNTHERYEEKRCHGYVCDVTKDDIGLPEESLDCIVLIFVLSAVPPEIMDDVLAKLVKCLKPGGIILMRDYGRFDLAQLRFKANRFMRGNLYARGDGTMVYFFNTEELREMMLRQGLEEMENNFDRRLLVNRGRRVTMQRVWVQLKYRRPLLAGVPSAGTAADPGPV